MTDDRRTEPDLDDTQAFDDEGLEADESRRAQVGRPAAGSTPIRSRSRAVAVDPSLRIRDRWSELFVIGTVLVFVAIFLFALAYGKGGAFTPERTPRPPASATVAPSVLPSGSAEPSPAESAGESAAPTAGESAAPSPVESPAPSS